MHPDTGKRIRGLIAFYGETLTSFSTKAGISSKYLKSIINNTANISIQKMDLISENLYIDTVDLFFNDVVTPGLLEIDRSQFAHIKRHPSGGWDVYEKKDVIVKSKIKDKQEALNIMNSIKKKQWIKNETH